MTAAGAVTILHSFTGADGVNPVAALIQGADGNLYGTASNSGNGPCVAAGTAFQSTLTGSVTVLFSFSGSEYGLIGCPAAEAERTRSQPCSALVMGI